MGVVEVDLRLQSPEWRRAEPRSAGGGHDAGDGIGENTDGPIGAGTPASTAGLWVRSDLPCPDPTDPDALASHPGRLAAVRVGRDEVVLAQDRIRSWPLLWALEEVPADGDGGRSAQGAGPGSAPSKAYRLIISDDSALMREFLGSPRLDPRAREEFLDAGFVTGTDTLLAGVNQTLQGAVVRIDRHTGRARTVNHSLARFTEDTAEGRRLTVSDPDKFAHLLKAALDDGLGRVLDGLGDARLVVPLSGGLDSRLLAAWLTLHRALDRVVAFTYGRPGTREVKVSRQVAEAVGMEWHAVDYDPAALREAWQTPEAAAFLEESYNLNALPHVQDWYALRQLLDEGVLRRGDIVLPGHTVVGNMHHEELLEDGPATRVQVARAITWHHQELQGRQKRAWADPYRAAKLKEFLALTPFTGSARDVQNILESYNVRERQTKYINNSVRAYEHLGLEWALPMLDIEFWCAWHRGAVELTATRDFYAVFIADLWARATAMAGGAGQSGAKAGAAPAPAAGDAEDPGSAGDTGRQEDDAGGPGGSRDAGGSGGSGELPYFAATQVDARTRSRLKSMLAKAHLLGLAERAFSTWATLHSTMSFDAFITDSPRPVAAIELMGGRKLLGFWTRAFITDTWCRQCRLFSDLPVAPPAPED